ncbi:YceI family protein [Agaribacter flavus]|uniref:YceI family protein n=1 Tax=Agaribacter flavus TaxID=1902781 RepID=A0ABV7FQL4_9ALTE
MLTLAFKNLSRHSAILITGLLLLSTQSFANYSLDLKESSVHFLSTKNINITEIHSFDKFSGNIDASGKLMLSIDLSSVNTLIPIRNERMRKMLFNVVKYATAEFNANLDKSILSIKAGQVKNATIEGNLSMSGKIQAISFEVRIVGLQDGRIFATTTKPTLIHAEKFGLQKGLEALREIAKLKQISTTVPLSFAVTFSPE